MLEQIITYLQAIINPLNIYEKINGIAIVMQDGEKSYPVFYDSSGNLSHASDFDFYASQCYFRQLNPYSEVNAESPIGGQTAVERTYDIRLVGICDKDIFGTDNRYIDDKILNNLSTAINDESADIITQTLKAFNVSFQVTSTVANSIELLGEEISGTGFDKIPFDKVFVAVDFEVTVFGSLDCFQTWACNDAKIDFEQLIIDKYCSATCADGIVTITNSEGTTLYTKEVASGGTATQEVADQQAEGTTGLGGITFPANTTGIIPDVNWTDSDGSSESAPYGSSIVCTPSKDLADYTNQELEDGLTLVQRNALSRVDLYKHGTPAVSYYNNDAGDNNPGRGTDFFTLPVNNPNGNTSRFEVLGTDVVIDWAYRKYWTRYIQVPGRVIWETVGPTVGHCDLSEALTLEGLTKWRLPMIAEYLAIMNTFDGDPLGYAPFNIVNGVTPGANFAFATGQTSLNNTTRYWSLILRTASRGYNFSDSLNKATNGSVALYCKDF